jgi:hypothetical protein
MLSVYNIAWGAALAIYGYESFPDLVGIALFIAGIASIIIGARGLRS